MSYNSSTQKITAPVSVYDVQRAVGASSPDVGTLCKDEHINKWAKFKPLKVAQIAPIGSSSRTSVNHGIINIPTWSYLSKMATFLFSDNRAQAAANGNGPSCGYSATMEYWDYDKPSGTSQSPYRLTDFSEYPVPSSSPKGYYHGAQAPIAGMESTSIQISPEGVLQVRFPLGASDPCTLTLSDLTLPDAGSTPVGSMYFGLLLKQTSGTITSRTYAITQATMMSQISGSYAVVEIPLTASDTNWVGTWKIFPIVSNVPISTLTTQISEYDGHYFFAPLPYHSQGITISIEYAQFNVNITNAFRASDGRYVTVSSTITNMCSESKNYRVHYIVYDAYDNVLATYDITSQSAVAGGASVNRSSNIDCGSSQSSAIRITATATVTDSGVVFKQQTDVSALIGDAPTPGD